MRTETLHSTNVIFYLFTWQTAFTNSSAGFFRTKKDPACTGNTGSPSLLIDADTDR